MEKIIVPESIKTIGYEAFVDCDKLTSAGTTSDNAYEYGWTTSIPENSFRFLSYLEDVQLASTLESLGHRAFDSCVNLEKVVLPSSLLDLGGNVFEGCTKLVTASTIETSSNIQFQ